MSFGAWVLTTREKKGLTRANLAAAAEVSLSTVYSAEQGTNEPRLGNAAKISEALGMPLWQALKSMEKAHGRTSSNGTKRKR